MGPCASTPRSSRCGEGTIVGGTPAIAHCPPRCAQGRQTRFARARPTIDGVPPSCGAPSALGLCLWTPTARRGGTRSIRSIVCGCPLRTVLAGTRPTASRPESPRTRWGGPRRRVAEARGRRRCSADMRPVRECRAVAGSLPPAADAPAARGTSGDRSRRPPLHRGEISHLWRSLGFFNKKEVGRRWSVVNYLIN